MLLTQGAVLGARRAEWRGTCISEYLSLDRCPNHQHSWLLEKAGRSADARQLLGQLPPRLEDTRRLDR
jgi:hypothetical protein